MQSLSSERANYMLDGFETNRAAINSRGLFERLDLKVPFSPTNGEVCFDQPIVPANYKGIKVSGKLKNHKEGSIPEEMFWIRFRGSLIKLANNGHHNEDSKDPFEILYAIDDIVTHLQLNAFRTPVNGLELSSTVQAMYPRQICDNVVSYNNKRPSFKTIDRSGARLPYTEIENGQHTLKVYSPVGGSLRVEVKINKMQFLGNSHPYMLADLVCPEHIPQWAAKLLAAFNKVIWECPNLDPGYLTGAERDLYLHGRHYNYWQVSQKNFESETDFRRLEKQRSREKEQYKRLILRHWPSESPADIQQRISEQLNLYADLAQSKLYKVLLDICLERWQYVADLQQAGRPACRLPNRLQLPQLSEIYPLYLGRFPTVARQSKNQLLLWPPPDNKIILSDEYADSTIEGKSHKLWLNNHYGNELRRLEKSIHAPRGTLYSETDIRSMLPSKVRIAMAVTSNPLF